MGPPSPRGGYRWVICGLLFFATTINYMDRQILSLLKPVLDQNLGWTEEQFGAVNAAFQAAYALSLLVFGWFIDRFGTKLGYALSIGAWSLAAMAHALVAYIPADATLHAQLTWGARELSLLWGYTMLAVLAFGLCRVCLGLGEGGNFPSAIKAVALWFPKKERAFATSIFNSGANVGAILAPAIIPWMAGSWGWQAAFIGAGIAGFLWLFFWVPFYNVPERHRAVSAAELAYIRSDQDETHAEGMGKVHWLRLLGYRQAWSFVVAKFLTDPVWWFFLIWLPDYFNATRHLDIKHSWAHLVTIYALVTVLSIPGGWLPGVLIKSGWSVTAARKTSMFLFALCVLPILLVTQASDWGAVLLIGLAGAAHQAWSANLYTTVSDMFPKHAVASLTGLGSTFGSISGFFFPLFTGFLLGRFTATGNVTAGYTILFAICGVAYLVAFFFNHLLAPRFEPVPWAEDNPGTGPSPEQRA